MHEIKATAHKILQEVEVREKSRIEERDCSIEELLRSLKVTEDIDVQSIRDLS
jgi:hypothetical protein